MLDWWACMFLSGSFLSSHSGLLWPLVTLMKVYCGSSSNGLLILIADDCFSSCGMTLEVFFQWWIVIPSPLPCGSCCWNHWLLFGFFSHSSYNQLLLFSWADLYHVWYTSGFFLFQDNPDCCIGCTQCVRNGSDWFSLIDFESWIWLIFFHGQLSGHYLGWFFCNLLSVCLSIYRFFSRAPLWSNHLLHQFIQSTLQQIVKLVFLNSL